MPLKDELGMPHDIISEKHETLMNIVVAAHMLEREGDRLVQPFGISMPQFNILMLLRYQANSEGPDQQSLGRMLVVNRSNITGLLDRMEKNGLVERVGEKADRRIKRVRLTPKGRKNLEDAEAVYLRYIDELLGDIDTQKRQALRNALEKLRANLRRRVG